MKKVDEMDVGERMIDNMPKEIAKLSAHLCMKKICKDNHFCSLDYEHPGNCLSLLHNTTCE